jgi:hypothetical protein
VRIIATSPEIFPAYPPCGALCAEAQADGVPCAQLGVDCQVCGRAAAHAATLAVDVAPGATGVRRTWRDADQG